MPTVESLRTYLLIPWIENHGTLLSVPGWLLSFLNIFRWLLDSFSRFNESNLFLYSITFGLFLWKIQIQNGEYKPPKWWSIWVYGPKNFLNVIFAIINYQNLAFLDLNAYWVKDFLNRLKIDYLTSGRFRYCRIRTGKWVSKIIRA